MAGSCQRDAQLLTNMTHSFQHDAHLPAWRASSSMTRIFQHDAHLPKHDAQLPKWRDSISRVTPTSEHNARRLRCWRPKRTERSCVKLIFIVASVLPSAVVSASASSSSSAATAAAAAAPAPSTANSSTVWTVMKPELPTTPPSPFVILFRMRLKPGHRTHRAGVWSPVIQCDAGRCTPREWPGGQ